MELYGVFVFGFEILGVVGAWPDAQDCTHSRHIVAETHEYAADRRDRTVHV